MAIPTEHRAFLLEMRGIETDREGREVLRGLSFDETEEYFAFLEDRLEDRDTPNDSTRYLDLDAKYQAARLAIVAAEIEARSAGRKH